MTDRMNWGKKQKSNDTKLIPVPEQDTSHPFTLNVALEYVELSHTKQDFN